MITTIRRTLRRAYRYFGITQATELNQWVRHAMEYLEQDREHYIVQIDPENTHHLYEAQCGTICKLVPIAQELIIDEDDSSTKTHKRTLMLLVTKVDATYVTCYEKEIQRNGETHVERSFPIYAETSLDCLKKDMTVLPPRSFRPVATVAQRDNYYLIFMAYMRVLQNSSLMAIPRNTEFAVWALDQAQPTTVQTAEGTYSGTLVELARGPRDQKKDHNGLRTTSDVRLCYMVAETGPQFLLKLTSSSFSEKTKLPTKEEIYYTPVQLEQLEAKMTSVFF